MPRDDSIAGVVGAPFAERAAVGDARAAARVERPTAVVVPPGLLPRLQLMRPAPLNVCLVGLRLLGPSARPSILEHRRLCVAWRIVLGILGLPRDLLIGNRKARWICATRVRAGFHMQRRLAIHLAVTPCEEVARLCIARNGSLRTEGDGIDRRLRQLGSRAEWSSGE